MKSKIPDLTEGKDYRLDSAIQDFVCTAIKSACFLYCCKFKYAAFDGKLLKMNYIK